jgi:hypothetical protein
MNVKVQYIWGLLAIKDCNAVDVRYRLWMFGDVLE